MKYDLLKKRIMVESGVAAGLLLVLAAIAFYCVMLRDDYEDVTGVLKREVTGLQQEVNLLREKFSKVQTNSSLYQEAIEKRRRGELDISRQAVRRKFNRFNDEFFLGNLRITMSSIENAEGDNYQRPNGFITQSDVSVNFEAVSDEYVYAMMNTMVDEMGGTVRFTKLSLLKQRTISDDILRVISQKGIFPLVAGEIRFKWYGLKLKDKDEVEEDQ